MKNLVIFTIIIALSGIGFSQSVDDIDFISPFNEGIAAVQKDGKWAFINTQGEMLTDFRSDLVATETESGKFPVFKNERCIIKEKRNGIYYFGYIDTIGTVVVTPQFLNASNFDNGLAIVLELEKVQVGTNSALGKNVSYDKYSEAIIDGNGEIKGYVSPKMINVILDKKFLRCPPKITSKRISENLYAMKNDDGSWSVKVINFL